MIVQRTIIVTITTTGVNQPLQDARINVDSFVLYARQGNASPIRFKAMDFNTTTQSFSPPASALTDSTAFLINQNQARNMTNLSDNAKYGERYDLSKYVINGTQNDVLELLCEFVAPGV